MSKNHEGKKETKKVPKMSIKEKRALKREQEKKDKCIL